MRGTILPVVTAWMLAACGADPLQRRGDPAADAAAPPVRAAVGDTLRIRTGQSVEVGAEGLRIVFQGVAVDSRCPQGVTCVWSGDAAVRVGLAVRHEAWTPAELHTHLEPAEVQHGAYTVALLDVEPYPREGVPARVEDYVAVIRVTRP